MNFVFQKTEKTIYFLRLISLDIVLGVTGGLYFASVIFGTRPSLYYYLVHLLAVWVIYCIDHILDGIRTHKDGESGTYQFYYKNRKILLTVGIFSSFVAVFLFLFFLERELLQFGAVTSLLVILYLMMNYFYRNKRVFFPKELLIAILYTWGVFGGVFVLKGSINQLQTVLALNYFLIVLANVFLFSLADFNEKVNYETIVIRLGEKKTENFIVLLLLFALLTSFVTGFTFSTWVESFTLVLMNLTLMIFALFPAMVKSRFFAIIADSVFIYPLLFYLIFLEA